MMTLEPVLGALENKHFMMPIHLAPDEISTKLNPLLLDFFVCCVGVSEEDNTNPLLLLTSIWQSVHQIAAGSEPALLLSRLLFTDGDGAGKIQLQSRGSEPNMAAERRLWFYFIETYSFSSVSYPASFQRSWGRVVYVTMTGMNFTCTGRVVPLVDLFNFDLHEWFLESVDIHTEFSPVCGLWAELN